MASKRYVLGFYLTPDGVVLIRKIKPAWQFGKWNGIGGSIEEGETPLQAMMREFREEARIVTTSNQWTELFTLSGAMVGNTEKGWQMTVFAGKTSQSIQHLFPFDMDEGTVAIVADLPSPMDSTAAWLLPMCRDLSYHGISLAPA